MKSGLELLKERMEIYSGGKTEKADIVRFLRNAGVKFEDASEEVGYPNLRIHDDGGYVRLYKGTGMKDFKVQIFRKSEMRYSGIPTFEPSGRRSL